MMECWGKLGMFAAMEGGLTYRKTRIAPTPSGFLHLGNVLSFVRTIGMARDRGASVLLRIDDMDRDRVETEYLQDIFFTLNFLELPWEEGPRDVREFEGEWSQVHRLGMYREALEELRERGEVFACNCSRAQVLRSSPGGVYPGTCRDKGISLDAENVSWRLRTGDEEVKIRMVEGGRIVPEGFVSRGSVMGGYVSARLPDEMKDFVVRKRDGFPAYQLSSVVDDLFFGVDLVVRGEDLWASTVAQHYLAGKLGTTLGGISFYHHALLKAGDGRKLSKSAGDTSIQYLRKQGLAKKEVFAMLARMMGVEGQPRGWEELWSAIRNDNN
ncbi:MAG: tRNA glutamyl-Q synthetase [Bacteroidetes bacterium]|nr:tRNA glutamyl-Q synthetase [Bacteroidota bacterium]